MFNQPLLVWSTAVISLSIAIVGVVESRAWLVVLSAIFIVPFTLFLNYIPTFHGFALVLPVLHIASAVAVKEESDVWAWLFIAPSIILFFWMIIVTWVYKLFI